VGGESLFVTSRLIKTPPGHFAEVGATGAFSTTVTLLDTLQPGSTLVLAVSGTGGDQASANFTVAQPVPPALQVSPKAVPAGNAITVSGQGFGPDESVALSLENTALIPSNGTAVTDALGAFTTTVTVTTTLAPGSYHLHATGAVSHNALTAPLSVLLPQSNHWYFAEGFTGQGPSVFFHETITLLNPNDQTTTGAITYEFPDGSTESLPLQVAAHGLLVQDVNNDLGPNRIVSALVQTDQPIAAERTILRSNAAKRGLDTDFSPGENIPQTNWYFAEGYSGVTFQPYLTVQNPTTNPITLTVTLFPTSGAVKVIPATLPDFGRYTLNLRAALPNRSFSISVSASGPVVAERVEYWGAGAGSAKFGAGVKPGVAAPATRWYFGYASILGGDQAFISLLNPNHTQAKVTATFLDGTGKGAGTTTITVKAGKRATMDLDALLHKVQHSPVAVVLNSNVAIVAEEAQYFGGSPNTGSHPGASIEGRQSTATRWSFASGDTAHYKESEYILNPSSTSTTVVGRFLGADGQVLTASYQVKANAVISLSANAIPGLHKGTHGSIWTTTNDLPVVVVQVLRANDGRSALADQGIPG
jgi:hypothetical protein